MNIGSARQIIYCRKGITAVEHVVMQRRRRSHQKALLLLLMMIGTAAVQAFTCMPQQKRSNTIVQYSSSSSINKALVGCGHRRCQSVLQQTPTSTNDVTTFLRKGIACIALSFVTVLLPYQIDVDVNFEPTTTTTTVHHTCDSTPQQQHSLFLAKTTPRIHRTNALALSEDQLLVTDVWKQITQQFFDTTYNGLGEEKWKQRRLDAVRAVGKLNSPDDSSGMTYAIIRTMIAELNDPYTRFLTPEQFETLTTYARGGGGNGGGVGISLIVDPTSNRVTVVSVSPNSPAQLVGIQSGDSILSVNGEDMSTATAELVAMKCRGAIGTNVVLQTQRGNNKKTYDVARAVIPNNPVQSTTYTTKDGTKVVGVIKLTSFNQETVSQMITALRGFKSSLNALVIDLRGNAGGYMPAGVDAAKLFLLPQQRIISEIDKSGRSQIFIRMALVWKIPIHRSTSLSINQQPVRRKSLQPRFKTMVGRW